MRREHDWLLRRGSSQEWKKVSGTRSIIVVGHSWPDGYERARVDDVREHHRSAVSG